MQGWSFWLARRRRYCSFPCALASFFLPAVLAHAPSLNGDLSSPGAPSATSFDSSGPRTTHLSGFCRPHARRGLACACVREGWRLGLGQTGGEDSASPPAQAANPPSVPAVAAAADLPAADAPRSSCAGARRRCESWRCCMR